MSDITEQFCQLGADILDAGDCSAIRVCIGDITILITDVDKQSPPTSPDDNCIMDMYVGSGMYHIKTIDNVTAADVYVMVDVAVRWWQYCTTGDIGVLRR